MKLAFLKLKPMPVVLEGKVRQVAFEAKTKAKARPVVFETKAK